MTEEIVRGKYFVPFESGDLNLPSIYIYHNEELSLIHLVHHIIRNLRDDRPVNIVYSSEESIRPLVRYLNIPSWKNRFAGHPGIRKDRSVLEPAKRQYYETMYSWFTDIEEALENNRHLLHQGIFTRYNYTDIIDIVRQRPEGAVFHDLDLQPEDDLSEMYKSLLQTVRKAQDKYEYGFSHVSYANPFKQEITSNYSSAELREQIDAFLDKTRTLYEEIIENSDAINRERFEQLYIQRDILWENYIELKTMYLNAFGASFVIPPERLSAVRPIMESRGVRFQMEEGPEALIDKLKKLVSEFNQRIENAEDEIAVTYQKDETFLSRMYHNVDTLQQEIIDAGIFRNFIKAKTAGIELNVALLKDITGRLEAGLAFIEEQKSYFEWQLYYRTLEEKERKLVGFLIDQDVAWEEAFEHVFFENVFYEVHRSLHPLKELYRTLRSYHAEFERACLINLLNVNGDIDTAPKITFFKAGETDSGPDTSLHIYLDHLPEKSALTSDTWTVLRGEAFKKKAETLANTQNISCREIDAPFIREISPFSHLNSSDKLQQSLYLGQSLYKINPDCTIFEMKHVSIISYLSPLKNNYLLKNLNEHKIKEIRSDSDNQNLLPGILSKEEKERFVLVEDGMLAAPSEIGILTQLNLMKKLKEAGIVVIPVFNYNFRINGRPALDDVIANIESVNVK